MVFYIIKLPMSDLNIAELGAEVLPQPVAHIDRAMLAPGTADGVHATVREGLTSCARVRRSNVMRRCCKVQPHTAALEDLTSCGGAGKV